MLRSLAGLLAVPALLVAHAAYAAQPSICTFQCDATPPLGSPLCYASVEAAQEIVDPLTVRGVVLLGAGEPIVLCAVDWVGIANASYDEFRQALAEAAGTSIDRVALHMLHQHDAPGADSEAESLLASRSLSGKMYHLAHFRKTVAGAADALRQSLTTARPFTHLGVGRAKVERVASNRRILGDDGKVQYVRFSSCKIPEVIAAPEGVIDPLVRAVSFWNGDKPLAVLSYYATHPQSHYGKGGVSWDFVGMARQVREAALPGVPHIHFNGAGGNVAAGKYNDGAPQRRPELAGRLADGMAAAWKATERAPIAAADVEWRTCDVLLPLREALVDERPLVALLDNGQAPLTSRIGAALDLTWARRVKAERPIQLSCLRLPGVYVLHMPGELFVEYQLAAAQMRPEATVCMAAYGDGAPGYIGTQIGYSQGGYETGPASRTAPEVEKVLTDAVAELLK
jgi:hypothetical protein